MLTLVYPYIHILERERENKVSNCLMSEITSYQFTLIYLLHIYIYTVFSLLEIHSPVLHSPVNFLRDSKGSILISILPNPS